MKNSKFKFWFDVVMAVVLCLLFNPRSTGLAFHEIAGLVLGGAVIVHVLINKNWVWGITKKIFSKDLNGKTRFSYILNIILFMDMFFMIISGLLISKIVTPNFRIFPDINWLPIHIFSSILGIVIIGVHVGLHWNWIKQIGGRFPKLAKLFTFRKPSPKLVSLTILIVGTVFLSGQIAKMVSIAPSIFSDNGDKYEQEHNFEKHGDSQQVYNRNGQNEGDRDVRNGKNFHGHEESSSIFLLAGNVPNLILYSSALGSMAFYTYLVGRRPKEPTTIKKTS